MKKNLERRGIASSERAIEQGEDKKIRGVASVFNSESRDLGGFTEVIDRHAFDEALEANPDVTCLWNHNSDDLLTAPVAVATAFVDRRRWVALRSRSTKHHSWQ